MIRTQLLLPALLASIVAFAACTPPPPPQTDVSAPAESGAVVLTGARAFAVAELAYITAADGVGRLVDAGVIRGERAAWVRARNAEATSLMIKGKAAADTAEQAAIAARLIGITESLNRLLGGR